MDEAPDLEGGRGQVRQTLGGHAGDAEQLGHAAHEVVGLDVALLEHGGVRRVQADPRAAGLTDPSGEAVVVRMDVRHHDSRDVGDRPSGRGQPVVERLPGVVGVPPGVDEGDALVRLEGVDEDVAKGVVRDRDGDRPQAGPHLLDRREHLGLPGRTLQRPGDLESPHGPRVSVGPPAGEPTEAVDGREGGI